MSSCLGRLWNLLEAKPCWRKWVAVGWALSFLTHPTSSLSLLFPGTQRCEKSQRIPNCTLHCYELPGGLYHLKEEAKCKCSSLNLLLLGILSQPLEKQENQHGGLWCWWYPHLCRVEWMKTFEGKEYQALRECQRQDSVPKIDSTAYIFWIIFWGYEIMGGSPSLCCIHCSEPFGEFRNGQELTETEYFFYPS